jgi:hypothetical protein
LNFGRGAVVDANFSTLWPTEDSAASAPAILALLNSGWASAYFETACTVLGGGALKVEAAHIRRLPVPKIDRHDWRSLERLGAKLIQSEGAVPVRSEIDKFLANRIMPDSAGGFAVGLERLAGKRLRERS